MGLLPAGIIMTGMDHHLYIVIHRGHRKHIVPVSRISSVNFGSVTPELQLRNCIDPINSIDFTGHERLVFWPAYSVMMFRGIMGG